MQYTKAKYYNLLLLSICGNLKTLSKIKLNTYNQKKNQCTWNIENTQGKASAKNPTICIIIQGGNTSRWYKTLALTASQILVQSSWMLTGKQGFSQTFSSALQASYFLAQFLLGPPAAACVILTSHTTLTSEITVQSWRRWIPSVWMSFF